MTTWIQNKRKLSGLSQEEVAQSLSISRPTYLKLEQGILKPTAQQKALLARIFSVSEETIEKGTAESAAGVTKSERISDDIRMRDVPVENVAKFKEVLLYILSKVGSRPNIGQTALYKLLYFIDFDYFEKFEEQFIGATYIKNTYGPTPVSFAKIVKQMEREGRLVEVKSKFFDHDQTKYIPVTAANVSALSGQELKHIDDELERLAHFTARQLSDLSHKDTPWRVAKDKEVIDYEYVFYRPEETSVREYEPL